MDFKILIDDAEGPIKVMVFVMLANVYRKEPINRTIIL